ncbi:MAG: MFS transporter [Actinomycetia bacterium]|nr:MFS transporter [Actinomycetes bacterium]
MAATVDELSSGSDAPAVAKPWWALGALLVGLSIIIIDGSVVNVLLPDMVNDLGLTQTGAQWVNSIYSLVFASLLITVGLLADRFGRRRLFLIGIAVFMAASLGSALAQSPAMLIGSRAVQAVGASMMLPSSIAVINVLFTGKRRAMAFGFWGAVFGGAAALGPLLGGFLAEEFSWRWAFLINIPIGLIAGIAVWKLVPETRGPEVRGYDPLGIVLSATGLGLIVWGLIEGQDYGWWSSISDFDLGPLKFDSISPVPVALAAGALMLAGLVLWERMRSKGGDPTLIDLDLFRIRRYGFGNVVALVVSLGEFGILFVLPLWIQSVHGYDSLVTGAILATLALGTLTAGGAARHLSAAVGATNVVRIGMGLEVVSILGIGWTLSVSRSPWWLAVPLVFYGLGVGFATAQLTNVVLEDVPPARSGQASAMTSTFRQVGSALGAACLGAILFSALSTHLQDALEQEKDLTDAQRDQITQMVRSTAGQAIVQLDEVPKLAPEAKDARDAYTSAARDTSLVAAGFVFLGLLVSFGLPASEAEKRRARGEPDPEDEEATV